MLKMPLNIFTESEDFPFFIHYGSHVEDDCFMHGHEDFSELVIVLEGTAEHIVGKESYPISKGDVFVVNQYTEHGYIGATDFKICNIMFRPEIMFDKIYNIRQSTGFQALFVIEPNYFNTHRFCSRLRLDTHDFTEVKKIIENMMMEYYGEKDGNQTLVYAYFMTLCVTLSRLYCLYDSDSRKDIMKLASAIAYIEKNYCENINITELSHIAGYSERQFSRLFNITFSTTPNLYITNLRIQKSQQLLITTNLSIGEISWSCGFEDQNYFSRTFKKHTGMTPTEYRKK